MNHGCPIRQGLYDPAARARRLRRRLRRRPEGAEIAQARPRWPDRPLQPRPPRRLRLRGQHRRRRRHPDPDPPRVPQGAAAPRSGSTCPSPGGTASARSSPRRSPSASRLRQGPLRADRARRSGSRSSAGGGWRPTTRTLGASALAVEPADLPRLRRQPLRRRRRRLRAQALRRPQAVRGRDREGRARRPQVLLLLEPLLPDPRLQGDAHARAGRRLLRRRPGGRAARQRPLHVPLAVQHQHLPELGAGPPLPDDRPQRRDQHPPRQHQLDAGPRGPLRLRPVRAGRRREAQPDHPRGALRHRLPRQRRRAAGQGRATASPTP